MADQTAIPVARPLGPPIDAVEPYLHRMDAARIYTNFGPLNAELERRLATYFAVGAERVVTVANATLGLAAALNVATAGRGGACGLPAWTFAASGHATWLAGLTPVLTDVDLATGVLDFDTLAARRGSLAAVMAVSPFGQPLDVSRLEAFAASTKTPVVIDAAAGFDSYRPYAGFGVVSLHATKALGAGEGGVVVAPDAISASKVRRFLNFGFSERRLAGGLGLNGKLSEIAAAYALAALDGWAAARADWARVATAYKPRLCAAGFVWPDGLGTDWVSSTLALRWPGRNAATIATALAERGIGTHSWWGPGLHRQPAFAQAARDPLPSTEMLAQETVGLPCFRDMNSPQIDTVCAAIEQAACSVQARSNTE